MTEPGEVLKASTPRVENVPATLAKKLRKKRTASERSKWIGAKIKSRPAGMSAREAMVVYSREAKEKFKKL
jgi:hypothetical protein